MNRALAAVAAPDPQEQRIPTPDQGAAIGRLIADFRPSDVVITYEPFDLPTGYVLVQLAPSGFTAGIAPDGRASS
jgi:hypothetical protein